MGCLVRRHQSLIAARDRIGLGNPVGWRRWKIASSADGQSVKLAQELLSRCNYYNVLYVKSREFERCQVPGNAGWWDSHHRGRTQMRNDFESHTGTSNWRERWVQVGDVKVVVKFGQGIWPTPSWTRLMSFPNLWTKSSRSRRAKARRSSLKKETNDIIPVALASKTCIKDKSEKQDFRSACWLQALHPVPWELLPRGGPEPDPLLQRLGPSWAIRFIWTGWPLWLWKRASAADALQEAFTQIN